MNVEKVNAKEKTIIVDGTEYSYDKNDKTKEINYFDNDGKKVDFGTDKPVLDAEVKKKEQSLLVQILMEIRDAFMKKIHKEPKERRNKFPIVSNNFYEALAEAVEEITDANAFETMIRAQKMNDIQKQLEVMNEVIGKLSEDKQEEVIELITKKQDAEHKMSTIENNADNISSIASELIEENMKQGLFPVQNGNMLYFMPKEIFNYEKIKDVSELKEIIDSRNDGIYIFAYDLTDENNLIKAQQEHNSKDFKSIVNSQSVIENQKSLIETFNLYKGYGTEVATQKIIEDTVMCCKFSTTLEINDINARFRDMTKECVEDVNNSFDENDRNALREAFEHLSIRNLETSDRVPSDREISDKEVLEEEIELE